MQYFYTNIPVVSLAKPRCGYGRPQAGTRPYPALRAIAFGDAISALRAPSTTG